MPSAPQGRPPLGDKSSPSVTMADWPAVPELELTMRGHVGSLSGGGLLRAAEVMPERLHQLSMFRHSFCGSVTGAVRRETGKE